MFLGFFEFSGFFRFLKILKYNSQIDPLCISYIYYILYTIRKQSPSLLATLHDLGLSSLVRMQPHSRPIGTCTNKVYAERHVLHLSIVKGSVVTGDSFRISYIVHSMLHIAYCLVFNYFHSVSVSFR